MTRHTPDKKTTTTHPRTGRRFNMDAATYDLFRSAILQSLKASAGLTFTELSTEVARIIKKKKPEFKGSIPWYTISVRLDLETLGTVETFTVKRVKRNRLKARVAK